MRDLERGIGGICAVVGPHGAVGQQSERVKRIAMLMGGIGQIDTETQARIVALLQAEGWSVKRAGG